ncbi:MAG: hypothetical protein OHK0052_13680 [Anaerolineales bacterium]
MEKILNLLNDFKRLPVLRKFSVGMMMGVAIAWVLLRRNPADSGTPAALPDTASHPLPEIDITEPRLPLPAAASVLPAAQADDFTALYGIGPVFARRLHESGIRTFAQLAETPAETLLQVVQAKNWQKVDPQAWRAEARTRAA